MGAKSELFSKEALNKLRSPEKLDAMIQITNPLGWLALASIGLIVFSVVLWSVFGSVVSKVEGNGMLLDDDGFSNVTAIRAGRVERVLVARGSVVHKGDTLAVVMQPEYDADKRMTAYDLRISGNKKERAEKSEKHDAQELQRDLNGVIRSACNGIVDEVTVKSGDIVTQGSSICKIRCKEGPEEMMGVFYVPAKDGKRIKSGMVLQLTPSGVNSSKDGYVLAKVQQVSQYPVSGEAMQARLGNAAQAKAFLDMNQSNCMEITFSLLRDKDHPTGFLWSSTAGSPPPVTIGSFVSGFVIVDRVPPIEKVFYKISHWLRD